MGKMADNLCLGMAAVYSFFGITLAVAPKLFWGPDSQMSCKSFSLFYNIFLCSTELFDKKRYSMICSLSIPFSFHTSVSSHQNFQPL